MKKKLDITVAQNAAFCMGVRRALDFCLDASNDPSAPKPIFTVGPLIHNSQVLDMLEQKGIKTLDGEETDCEIGSAIIRAHGISPTKRSEIEKKSRNIIDATCPHVSKVQKIAQKYSAKGYKCIIVGDPGHAEVDGVLSYTGGSGFVVSGIGDAKKLGKMEKAVVVAQTTQNEETFFSVSALIEEKADQCTIFNTICKATHKRQSEAIELAQKVEAMIVVGGYNSANTCRLAQICADTNTPVFHVETEQDLSLEEVLEFRHIGITAGASTPNWMIRRIVDKLQKYDLRCNHPLALLMRRILAIPIRTKAFLGGGAAAITYAAFEFLRLSPETLLLCMGLAFSFITFQHLLHQYTKRKAMMLNEPDKGEFFDKNSRPLLLLLMLTCLTSLLLSFLLGPIKFIIILLGLTAGGLYCIPKPLHNPYRFLEPLGYLTGSKELFVVLAWVITTVLVPFLSSAQQPGMTSLIIFALFSGLVVFHRTLLTDMQDLEGDQLVGRETIAVALGRKISLRILLFAAPLQLLILLTGVLLGWMPGAGFFLLVVPGYCILINYIYSHDKMPAGEIGDALIDSAFYIAGMIALLAV